VRLLTVDLDALVAGTQWDEPVATHLQLVVQILHGPVVERVPCLAGGLLGPDERFMGVGEPNASEVGHRVGLDPDNIVQNPEAQILQVITHPVNVVITADHPQRTARFQHAAAGTQPVDRKGVVGLKVLKLIPVILDCLHPAVIRPPQFITQLQVVGRVGKNQVNRVGRQAVEHLHAVTFDDLIERQAGHDLIVPEKRADGLFSAGRRRYSPAGLWPARTTPRRNI